MKTKFVLSVLLYFAWLATPLIAQSSPANDNFADRILLTGALPISTTGSNVNATAESGEPSHYYSSSHSVWWSWTADHDGIVQIDAAGSSFYWTLAVYESPLSDPDIVVDNGDASGVTVTGAWTASTADSGFVGANYLHDGNTGQGTKSVRFTPTIATAGNYDVYLRWTADTNRATNVPVDVIHAGGTSTFQVNEQTNGGSWVKLNSNPLALDAGTVSSVLVRTDGTDGFVIADAVRFVPALSFGNLAMVRQSQGEGAVSFQAKKGRSYQIAVDNTYPYYYYYQGSVVLAIKDSSTPTITSSPDVAATVTDPSRYQITANTSPYPYYVYNLPYGVYYDSNTGLISGTPYYTGNYTATITAYGSSNTAYGSLSISAETLQPTVTSPTSATATEGQPFNYQITATKNPTSYSASGLPSGLTLDGTSGLISGTPRDFGYFYVNISATNSHGTGASTTLYLYVISARPVVSGDYQTVSVGDPFSYQISASKNPTSYDAIGLPPGLSIDTATGIISGAPTASGSYDVELSASNSYGPGTATLTLDVFEQASDNFATRIPLKGSAISLLATNDGATKEPGEPDHAGDPGGSSVWWTWTAPESAQYQITADGSFDVLFAVYEGTSLRALKTVTSNVETGNGRTA